MYNTYNVGTLCIKYIICNIVIYYVVVDVFTSPSPQMCAIIYCTRVFLLFYDKFRNFSTEIIASGILNTTNTKNNIIITLVCMIISVLVRRRYVMCTVREFPNRK